MIWELDEVLTSNLSLLSSTPTAPYHTLPILHRLPNPQHTYTHFLRFYPEPQKVQDKLALEGRGGKEGWGLQVTKI